MAGKSDSVSDSKLDALNTTLQAVENRLLHMRLDSTRDEVEGAYDCINQAAEQGLIDIECDGEVVGDDGGADGVGDATDGDEGVDE